MASKKVTKAVASNPAAGTVSEEVRDIPLSLIVADYAWNSRSGDWAKANGSEDHSFENLVSSIEIKGQDTPVIVRPHGKKFQLAAGFRRMRAIAAIGEKTGNKAPTIKAIIKPLSDAEMRSVNLRENTGRLDLKGPDLAHGVLSLYNERKKESGQEIPSTALAQELGKNQSYVAMLLRIMKELDPKVTQAWRETPMKVDVRAMDKITKLKAEPSRQMEAFKELLKGKSSEEDDGKQKTGRAAWLDAAKRKAAGIGALLGDLERQELIDTGSLTFSEHIDRIMKINKDATTSQKRSIAKAAEEAYQAALSGPSEEESDESSEESDD